MVEKELLADRQRVAVLRQRGDVQRGEFLVERAEAGFGRAVLVLELLQLCPAELAGVAAEPRVEDEVAEPEGDG
ncbi:hypothetical protein D3C83_75910 [compost metagenome]